VSSEFELIERYFASLTPLGEGILQGPGDDCARVRVPESCELAVSIDTLVEGVHFLAGTDAADIGWKSLACGLSDLAAMGASPAWCTLAITVPRADESWLAGFADGFGAIAREYGIALVGGDVTRGPLTISVQVAGHVRSGQALMRGGAHAGDAVCVSGTPGEAAAGLARLQAGTAEAEDPLVRRLHRPTPRVALGARLVGRASACIDVSDGLAADLGHILAASGVGATLDLDALPASDALRRAAVDDATTLQQWILHGGDDYELCFCVPAKELETLPHDDSVMGPITVIGEIEQQAGLRAVRDGATVALAGQGYRHFATNKDD
jgi:thiamine-monophosphate kinase